MSVQNKHIEQCKAEDVINAVLNTRDTDALSKFHRTLEEHIIPMSDIANEISSGKRDIVNALNARSVQADAEKDSLTELAAKVYKVKNPVAFTVPAVTSNELANDFFNIMFKSQGYDQIYESVYETYCSEDGLYVGCLMTGLSKAANTSIQLIGADAYYIYEEDIFYKTGEGGKLIQFLNGSEVQLTTDKHLWDTAIASPSRIVFYLYLPNSTANGQRENVHVSNIDYCRNSTIPYIKYSSNSGRFMYFHLSNPESCVLSYGAGTNTRTVFFYSNVETCSDTMALTGNKDYMYFLSLENLKSVAAGAVVNSAILRNIEFPNLENMTGGTLLLGYKDIKQISLPKLKSIDNGRLFHSDNTTGYKRCGYLSIHLPELEYIAIAAPSTTGCAISVDCDELELTIRSGCRVRGFASGVTSNSLYTLRINCEELYTTLNDASDKTTTASDIYAQKIYFNGLRKGTLYLGGTGSLSMITTYMYVNCIGGRTDEIKIFHSNNPGAASTLQDIEISEGTRQPLTFTLFRGLLPENIVSHIFERLADNRYEDDGVTPAPAIKITLGSITLNTLTDEEKAIATDKNYILA